MSVGGPSEESWQRTHDRLVQSLASNLPSSNREKYEKLASQIGLQAKDYLNPTRKNYLVGRISRKLGERFLTLDLDETKSIELHTKKEVERTLSGRNDLINKDLIPIRVKHCGHTTTYYARIFDIVTTYGSQKNKRKDFALLHFFAETIDYDNKKAVKLASNFLKRYIFTEFYNTTVDQFELPCPHLLLQEQGLHRLMESFPTTENIEQTRLTILGSLDSPVSLRATYLKKLNSSDTSDTSNSDIEIKEVPENPSPPSLTSRRRWRRIRRRSHSIGSNDSDL